MKGKRMKNESNVRNKTILGVFTMVIVLFLVFLFSDDKELQKEVVEKAIDTATEIVAENESTTEIPNLTETDEQTVEVQETNIENKGFEEQGQVAYEGSEKTPNVSVGNYVGLTYYSQIDTRWSGKMYSSINDRSQTIGTSGCGPTSAAMVVSSTKGTITPDKMADLYMKYGYRSTNQGTYWSAFKWTADVFNIEYSECYKLDDAVAKLKSNHYIIASCNQGLFTYGGHFIVLTGIEGNYIKVYDPYLYSGKFDVSSRKGKAEVKGNTVYVTIDNFRKYANYQKFFCYKNYREDVKDNWIKVVISNSTQSVPTVDYKVRITAQSGLNIRSGASTSYARVGGYSKDTIVNITAESNGFGKTDKGWICLTYTSRDIETLDSTTTTGITKKLSKDSILYSNSNLTGIKYNYRANTTITILQNISANVDRVRVNQTGRIAYINNNCYTNVVISKSKSTTVGQYRRFKAQTTLYSNSNLSGNRYSYLPQTQVKIVRNVNSNIDYVYVVKTNRYAYVNINSYK